MHGCAHWQHHHCPSVRVCRSYELPAPSPVSAQACTPLVHAAFADASQEFSAPVKNVYANSGAFRSRNHTLPSLLQTVGANIRIPLNINSGRRTRTSKPKPEPPRSPPLPSFEILKACAEAADSPHKTCSACHSVLVDVVFRLLSVAPFVSLCKACFEAPTAQVGQLLVASCTVQQVSMPNVPSPAEPNASTTTCEYNFCK